jgi:hypothetical protein
VLVTRVLVVGVGNYGVLCIEARDFDDGAATEEKMCRGGVGVLYGGQRRRSVGVA